MPCNGVYCKILRKITSLLWKENAVTDFEKGEPSAKTWETQLAWAEQPTDYDIYGGTYETVAGDTCRYFGN